MGLEYVPMILLMATRNPVNSPADMVDMPLFTGFYEPGGAGFLPSTVSMA